MVATQTEATQYSTKNLYEAAYCLCIGLKIKDRKRTYDGKSVITFEGPNAEERARDYYNGATVTASSLFDAFRKIKDYALA